ncbi:MAG TPA: xylulokinase [Woeseiaceae bacterium]|nr:xylulokinase [Woeseiaceae bacterium]
MNTVLGLDLGTQGMKAVFYEYRSREVVAAASSGLEVLRDDNGAAEQLAESWIDALSDCLEQVPAPVRDSVKAIGVSGQQHGFVAVDGKGEVLAPVKLWCDTSTQAEADAITLVCGGRDRCIKLAGNPVLTGYTAPKVLWLKTHRPDLYRQLAHILLPHDYLNFVLTGVPSMEFGDASGTAFLDVRGRRWSEELLRAIDPDRDLKTCLPPLSAAGQFIGETTAAAAAKFRLPAGVPVSTGGGDNMMGAIGTGNVSPGKLTMSLGSSGTLYAYSDTPVVDPNGNVAAFCSSTGGWLPLICTMNCTLGTELVCQSLDIRIEDFDDVIQRIDPGSDGLITLPFFNGERTPDLPNAKGCLLGLDSRNFSKGHILRSTVEGATYALRFGLDELTKLGMQSREIILTGGGANSSAWRQIVADICDLPVTILEQDEGASFGAALQALWALQRQSDPSATIDAIVAEHLSRDVARCTSPKPRNRGAYSQGYAAYRRAVEQIAPLYTTRTTLTRTSSQS